MKIYNELYSNNQSYILEQYLTEAKRKKTNFLIYSFISSKKLNKYLLYWGLQI